MQVFIVDTPFKTAQILDKRHLNKQIIECGQILDAIEGKTSAWANHPCTIQYKDNVLWLRMYKTCLLLYKNGDIGNSYIYSELSNALYKPSWHTQEYFDNMKRRLYTKDHEHYKQWESLGESYENWYWVDNQWKIYNQKQ